MSTTTDTPVNTARAALERVEKHHHAKVAAARAAFESDPSDENAEALALAEGTADVQVERAMRGVNEAEQQERDADDARKHARLAELDAIVTSAPVRAAELGAKAAELVRALFDLIAECDELHNAAGAAAEEAVKLRGWRWEDNHRAQEKNRQDIWTAFPKATRALGGRLRERVMNTLFC